MDILDYKVNAFVVERLVKVSNKKAKTFRDLFEIARLVDIWKRDNEHGLFIVRYRQVGLVPEGEQVPMTVKKKGKKYTGTWEEHEFKSVLSSVRPAPQLEHFSHDAQIFLWDRLLDALAKHKKFEPLIDRAEETTEFVVDIHDSIFDNCPIPEIKEKIDYCRRWWTRN